MQKETEIKLRVSRETLAALREHPLLKKRNKSGWERRELMNQYFDTPERDLAQAKVALRLRKDGDVRGAGQSGTATHLRFLSVRRDEALIRRAKGEAETLLEQDPMLVRHPDLARALRAASDGQIEWMQRS